MSVKSLLPNEVTKWRLSLACWWTYLIFIYFYLFIYLQYYELGVCDDNPEKSCIKLLLMQSEYNMQL